VFNWIILYQRPFPLFRVKAMIQRFRKGVSGTPAIVDRAVRKAVVSTGAVIDSETMKAIKLSATNAYFTAGKIGKYIGDVNGDGKIDVEDLKSAAQKAGVAWNSIDEDLKSALLAGGAAGVGVNFIPIVGQLFAVPAFAVTTAYLLVVAKLRKIGKGTTTSTAPSLSPTPLPSPDHPAS
jgi:hypothetical protein